MCLSNRANFLWLLKTKLIKNGAHQEVGHIYSCSFLFRFFLPSILRFHLHLLPRLHLSSLVKLLKQSPSGLFYPPIRFPLTLCFITLAFTLLLKSGNAILGHSMNWQDIFIHLFLLKKKQVLITLLPCVFFLIAAVLPPAERALLPGAQSQVLRSRDCQCTGIPSLPKHRLQRPEAWKHLARLSRTHHSNRFWALQGEHRA